MLAILGLSWNRHLILLHPSRIGWKHDENFTCCSAMRVIARGARFTASICLDFLNLSPDQNLQKKIAHHIDRNCNLQCSLQSISKWIFIRSWDWPTLWFCKNMEILIKKHQFSRKNRRNIWKNMIYTYKIIQNHRTIPGETLPVWRFFRAPGPPAQLGLWQGVEHQHRHTQGAVLDGSWWQGWQHVQQKYVIMT